MEDILIGVTDRTIPIFIPDPASTTGAGKTGLNAAAVTVTYTRYETDNDVVHSDVTSSVNDLSALTDAHSDWGWKEVSSTLSKGQYRLDIADAVFASGAWYAVVQVTITSGTAAATPKAFRLVSRNDLDGVRLGLTALPNAAADAAGGLVISDAGGLDADAQRSDVAAILVDTAEIGAAGAGLTAINLPNQTMDIVGNITGNLSGSVGSVTGLTASDVAAIKAKTDNLPTDPADQSLIIAATDAIMAILQSTGVVCTAAERSAIADALLDRDMATGADSGSTTVRTARQALRAIRNRTAVSGGTLTVYKENDSTSSWTAAVTGTAGADPITEVNPAGP